MQIEKPGFKSVIEPEIVLHVQDVLEVNFEMVLGSVSQSMTVEAGAPTVQLATSSDPSANVNATTVRELPLNGRSWTGLGHSPTGCRRAPDPSVVRCGSRPGDAWLRSSDQHLWGSPPTE